MASSPTNFGKVEQSKVTTHYEDCDELLWCQKLTSAASKDLLEITGSPKRMFAKGFHILKEQFIWWNLKETAEFL